MKLIEMLRIVWINLMQNKAKVLLTSLGIIVGAVTIVMVIAIGKGGEAEIAGQFGDLSAATIYVNPDYSKMINMDLSKMQKFTEKELEQVKEENTALADIMLTGQVFTEVQVGKQKDYISVSGVMPQYESIMKLPVSAGENLSEQDEEKAAKTAVLGAKVAQKYFGDAQRAVGQTLKLKGRSFKITGVLGRKVDGMQGISPDESVFIPYSTMRQNLSDNDFFSIPQMIGLAKDIPSVAHAMKQIESTLQYTLDDPTAYMVEDAGSRIQAATKSARTMKMLLISVATIVFIVGGIGIMNVLFVSVRERTREIGILKALGSSKGTIMMQFLLESVIISLFGGLSGVLLSYVLMPLMNYTDIPVLASWQGQAVALLFAVLTGTVFGFYPAYKASKLKPIDALNYE